jgi:hypothetical protein
MKAASFSSKVIVSTIAFWRNDAMDEFIKKHEPMIVGQLSGFDRVRFRGTIPMLAAVPGLVAWMKDCTGSGRMTGFKSFALELTERLKASVEQVAAAAGRSVKYLASSVLSKEDLVQELLAREKISEGLVCVLSCVEPCRSFDVYRDRQKKWIDLVPSYRKCLHWYLYFIDPLLGLCHVRIQSWLPFTVHVCVNGREWLCRELDAAGVGFRRRDNCLVDVADFAAAQKLLDAQPWANWTRILNDLLHRACPGLSTLCFRGTPFQRYWSADETEWATDILFRSSRILAERYPALIRHAMTTFSSCDVLRFLGRSRSPMTGGVHPSFQGEVVSDVKSRPEGVRIKHRANRNSIKMYDKQGSVLRIETTINDARDMKVYRASGSDPGGPKSWRKLRKGVVDLPRRTQISQGANTRYLAALAAVDAQTPLGKVADAVSTAVTRDGRRARGLNPLTGEDARVASILLHGEFSISGFRNGDVRTLLYPEAQTADDRHRASGKVTRLLRLFRAHGLIQKIPGTHRYKLTSQGRRTLPAFIVARNASTEKLNQLVA